MHRAFRERRRRRRAWRWSLAVALVAALVYMATAYGDPSSSTGGGAGAGGPSTGTGGRSVRAEVTVAAHAPMIAVPQSFLGLSTEYWALPLWSSQMPLLERVLAMVKVRGGGPLVLRVGGDSADHSFWDPDQLPMPRWAFSIAPSWLGQANQLVRTLGVRLILDLNLLTDSPTQAAEWAHAAERALPRGSIIAFEVGNEPDIYSRAAWLAITAGRQYLGRALPRAVTASDYVHDFRVYAEALEDVAPDVTLAGPALARPHTDADWVRALVAGADGSVGEVTVHRYPYGGCAHPGSRNYPTIRRLLSLQATAGIAASVRPDVVAAHDAGLPLRMTELNSVNCGGLAGVSNSFATALWAPDALFELVRAGVDGVNLHVRADTINAPFAITSSGLVARPLLYGLILFARALGPQARLVTPSTEAPASANLRTWVVRTGSDTLRVVLLDKGRRSVRVSLRLPATGIATVQRLIAPSAASVSGVTLGGQQLGADGRWQGTPVREVVRRRADTYTVQLRRASAALLSVRVAPGALGAQLPTPAAVVPSGAPALERRSSSLTNGRRLRAAGRAPRAVRSRHR
jgi:hypothetical protein